MIVVKLITPKRFISDGDAYGRPDIPDHVFDLAEALREIREDFSLWPHQIKEIDLFLSHYGMCLTEWPEQLREDNDDQKS